MLATSVRGTQRRCRLSFGTSGIGGIAAATPSGRNGCPCEGFRMPAAPGRAWKCNAFFRPASESLTWGYLSQGVKISSALAKLQRLFRYPRSELDCTIWSFPHQINLTFGRRAKRLHQDPACGGWGLRRTRPFSKAAFWAMAFGGSSTWIRQD
jgi:hypothetical protein